MFAFGVKAVFHSCIWLPLAKDYDNKIIILGSFAAGETCACSRRKDLLTFC